MTITGIIAVVDDFNSAEGSANDPAFFFVHASTDRELERWRAARAEALAPSGAPAARAFAAERIRGEMYDAVHAALAPCRADPRAWADHRYADALFSRDGFAKLFQGTGEW